MKKEKQIAKQVVDFTNELDKYLDQLNALEEADGEEAHNLNTIMLDLVSKISALKWVLNK